MHKAMKNIMVLFALILAPSIALAEVQVRDDVAVSGEAVMLSAHTKGIILSRGGELVEFKVDGKSLGKNLSGGDGWAFREFRPKKEKLYRIEASSGNETGTGLLLSLNRGRGIVFIDVQGALVKTQYSSEPREGSLDSIKRISAKRSIVYLSTVFPAALIRKWLVENEFPDAPLLDWRGGDVFNYVSGKGLRVMAVVGSATVAGSAREQKGTRLFSFEPAENAAEVSGWDEVEKGILK